MYPKNKLDSLRKVFVLVLVFTRLENIYEIPTICRFVPLGRMQDVRRIVCKLHKTHENSDSIRRDRSDLMVSRIKGALIPLARRIKWTRKGDDLV